MRLGPIRFALALASLVMPATGVLAQPLPRTVPTDFDGLNVVVESAVRASDGSLTITWST